VREHELQFYGLLDVVAHEPEHFAGDLFGRRDNGSTHRWVRADLEECESSREPRLRGTYGPDIDDPIVGHGELECDLLMRRESDRLARREVAHDELEEALNVVARSLGSSEDRIA
jgi:hypothetical protein